MASELVPVEQVDRDLARSFFSPGASREACLSGKFDDRPLLQAFARHRLDTLEAQASRIAELEAGLKAISTFKCDDGDEAGAFYAVRLRARTLLGDREG